MLKCKVCGGEFAGGESLGNTLWFKCRDCGSWMAGEPGDEPEIPDGVGVGHDEDAASAVDPGEIDRQEWEVIERAKALLGELSLMERSFIFKRHLSNSLPARIFMKLVWHEPAIRHLAKYLKRLAAAESEAKSEQRWAEEYFRKWQAAEKRLAEYEDGMEYGPANTQWGRKMIAALDTAEKRAEEAAEFKKWRLKLSDGPANTQWGRKMIAALEEAEQRHQDARTNFQSLLESMRAELEGEKEDKSDGDV
jgi:hypothetical protein